MEHQENSKKMAKEPQQGHSKTNKETERMKQIVQQQDAKLCQQNKLLELTVAIEPLKIDLLSQPEQEKRTQQPEQLPLKTEPLSDDEEPSQQFLRSFNLRSSRKQTTSKVGVASSGKLHPEVSHPEVSQPKKHSDSELIVSKQSQPRILNTVGHSEKESVSKNVEESQPRKSLRHSENYSTLRNVEELSPRKSLRHSEKEFKSVNIKESQPRKSLRCSAKAPLVIDLNESQSRESLGHSDEKLPLINLKESRLLESLGLSDEETPLTNLKELRPRKSRRLHGEETPLKNLKELRPRKSRRLHDEETPLINLKESQTQKSPQCLNEKSRIPRSASVETKVFTCSVCGLAMKRHAQLVKHLKWHEKQIIMDSISYSCNQCGIQYSQLFRLKSHIAAMHVAKTISRQTDSNHGDGSRQKSDEEIGRQAGKQQRNAEKVQLCEDRDDEMYGLSDAENDCMFEKDDQSVNEVSDQEDFTSIYLTDKVEKSFQSAPESTEPNPKATVADSKAETQATGELNSNIRRSSRLSSDGYIHRVIQGNGQQRMLNRSCEEKGEVVGQGQRVCRGRNDENAGKTCQLNASGDIGPQSADVQNVGDQQTEGLQGDQSDSGALTLKGNHYNRICRRLVGGIICHFKETIYPCSECGLELTRPSHLARHKLTRHAKKLQNCDICGLQCETTYQLQNHMRTDHYFWIPRDKAGKIQHSGRDVDRNVDERSRQSDKVVNGGVDQLGDPQSCPVISDFENVEQCREIGESSHIGDHQKEVQLGDELNSRELTLKGDHTSRICRRIVDGVTRYFRERIYACSECGLELTRPSHLARHMLSKHAQILQTCDVCGLQYETMYQLHDHMRTDHILSLPLGIAICPGMRQQEGRDVDGNGDKRCQQSEVVVSGGVGQQQSESDLLNCPVIGLKNDDAHNDVAGESDLQVESGQSGQENSNGRNVQLDVSGDNGPQCADVENVEQSGEIGKGSHFGDHQEEVQPGDELDSRSLTLKFERYSRLCRVVDGVIRYFKETIYPCSECGVELTRPSHLAAHKLKKHSKKLQNSDICGVQYEMTQQLQDHMRTDHYLSCLLGKVTCPRKRQHKRRDVDGNVVSGQSGKENSNGLNDQLDASEDIGPQSADVENVEQGRKIGEGGHVGDEQKEGLQGSELDSRALTLKGNHYSRICRRIVDGVTRYFTETIYPCSECGVELTRPSHLAAHKLKKHAKKLQTCDVCGLQYVTTQQLQDHMRTDHDLSLPVGIASKDDEGLTVTPRVNDQLLVCSICGLKVEQLSDLRKHLLTHESEKSTLNESYTCEVCGVVFDTSQAIRQHMLSHESNGQSLRKREWFGRLEGNKVVIVDSEVYYKECQVQDVELKRNQCAQDDVTNIKQETRCNWEDGMKKSGKNGKCDNERSDGDNGENHEEVAEGIETDTPSVDELVNEINREEVTLTACPTNKDFENLFKNPRNICDICGLRRNNPQQLERHMKRHALERRMKGTFLCDHCGSTYRCLGFLERHKLTHVVENSKVHCAEESKAEDEDMVNGIPISQIVTMSDVTPETTLLDESTDDKSATDSTLIQYNTFYICDECGSRFEKANELLRHKLEHRRGNTLRPFVCEECGQRYALRSLLERHLLTAHLNQRSELCTTCGKVFNLRSQLRDHMRMHTGDKPFKCDCGKGFTTRRAKEMHEALHTGLKPYKCEVCGKAFASKGTLTQHGVTHTGERRFACPLCDKRFTAGCALKTHLKFHSGDKPFSCVICSKVFLTRSNLQQHYVTHTKAKAFKCDICNKAYAQRSSLKIHMRLHQGLKPYSCQVCQMLFTSASNLRLHAVLHSSETPYPCCECGKSFKTLARLKHHILVHAKPQVQHNVCSAPAGCCLFQRFKAFIEASDHPCTKCGKRFSTPHRLRQHMVVHTGEKVCLCTLCGVGFTAMSSLSCHMRIHNGIKPYGCEVCGKRFTQAGNYMLHKSLHTGEKRFQCDICSRKFRLNHHMKRHVLRHTGSCPPKKRLKQDRRNRKRLKKVEKATVECKEQFEKFVEEKVNVPYPGVAEPRYDFDDSMSSEGSGSTGDGSSDEQGSSDDDDDESDHVEQD